MNNSKEMLKATLEKDIDKVYNIIKKKKNS